MKKLGKVSSMETNEDLMPAYRFDHLKAVPNRFADRQRAERNASAAKPQALKRLESSRRLPD